MRIKPEPEKIYHVYNRGVDKRKVFLEKWDFVRFIRGMREFNVEAPVGSLYEKDFIIKEKSGSQGVGHPIGCPTPKQAVLVEFLAYCLLPSHYHFLIREKEDGGISEFMKRLGGGYTNYFNKKYKRSGFLFQGKYKIISAENYSKFLRLSAYINCNAEVHKISIAEDWSWSSYFDYIGIRNGTMCNKDLILEEFGDSEKFKNFCYEVLPDIAKDKEIENSLLEI